MNFIVIGCLFLCLHNISGSRRADFGDVMDKFFVKLKRALPCDFDGQKIEPFVFDKSKVGHRPVELRTPDFFFKLDFNSLNMTGVNTFEVLSSVYNKSSKEYSLKIKPPLIHIMANYSFTQRLNGSIISAYITDTGFMKLNLTRTIFTTTIGFKTLRNGDFVIRNVSFSDSQEQFEPRFEYGKDVNKIVELLKPVYHTLENEVFKMIGHIIKVRGNVFLSDYGSIEEVTQALVDIVGPEGIGLFGQTLCDVENNKSKYD